MKNHLSQMIELYLINLLQDNSITKSNFYAQQAQSCYSSTVWLNLSLKTGITNAPFINNTFYGQNVATPFLQLSDTQPEEQNTSLNVGINFFFSCNQWNVTIYNKIFIWIRLWIILMYYASVTFKRFHFVQFNISLGTYQNYLYCGYLNQCTYLSKWGGNEFLPMPSRGQMAVAIKRPSVTCRLLIVWLLWPYHEKFIITL